MQVNEYAQARVKHIKQLGYVLKGCGRKAEETPMRADKDSKNRNKIQIIFTNLLLGGLLFQTMLICLGGVLLLQHWMSAISGRSLYCSKTYSMLWAVMTTATVFWAAAIAADTYSAVAIIIQIQEVYCCHMCTPSVLSSIFGTTCGCLLCKEVQLCHSLCLSGAS